MNSYYKEAAVGLLVLLGVGGFVVGTMWLRGRSIGNTPLVLVAYEDVGTLKEGAPVKVSGAAIGTVERIELVRPGKVVVGFSYDRKRITPTTAGTAKLVSVGMLGDMAIDYNPGTGQAMSRSDTLVGVTEAGLMGAVGGLAEQASQALSSMNRMMDTALVVELKETMATSRRLMAYLGDSRSGPTAEVNATMRALQGVSSRIDTLMAGLDAAALQGRVDSTMRSAASAAEQLAAVSGRLDAILAKIERGEGTIGQLMSDEGLYADLRKTLDATSALIDSLSKNPGKVGITVKLF